MLKGLLLASGSVLAFIIYGKDYGGKLGFGRLCALSGSFYLLVSLLDFFQLRP